MTNATAGRARQASRNDQAILAAAREVFLADPRAPISAVAERAGVGISALYRRYAGKEDLLRTLCHDGLRRFIGEAERAAGEPDGWAAFEAFLRGVVDADVHSLTVHLAGTFTPTAAMEADASRADALAAAVFERARPAMRAGAGPADVAMLLEMCAAVRVPSGARTAELRRRYLAVLLDGLRSGDALPGSEPAAAELNWRWQRPDGQPAARTPAARPAAAETTADRPAAAETTADRPAAAETTADRPAGPGDSSRTAG